MTPSQRLISVILYFVLVVNADTFITTERLYGTEKKIKKPEPWSFPFRHKLKYSRKQA